MGARGSRELGGKGTYNSAAQREFPALPDSQSGAVRGSWHRACARSQEDAAKSTYAANSSCDPRQVAALQWAIRKRETARTARSISSTQEETGVGAA